MWLLPYMWYTCDICDIYVIYVILPYMWYMWYCHTGDMWLQTELLENCWNILPRPHHRRPHPGSHNMAKRHQGTPARIFFWAFLFQYTLLYREAKLVDADKVLLTDHHHHQVHEESVIRWVKKNSVRFVEFVVLLIWNYVPDFNPSCFSWTRRTSTFGTRRFNSSENSETSTRASTNRISSKCRSRERENDLRQNKSMIRL